MKDVDICFHCVSTPILVSSDATLHLMLKILASALMHLHRQIPNRSMTLMVFAFGNSSQHCTILAFSSSGCESDADTECFQVVTESIILQIGV